MKNEISNLPLEKEFENWLRNTGLYGDRTIQSRISNVKTINKYYGSLLDLWSKDNFRSLMSDLSYSKSDEAVGKANPSKIIINGDLYTNLASYKSALNLYKTFLSSIQDEAVSSPFGEIGYKVKKALLKLSQSTKKRWEYSAKEVKSEIIHPLLEFLDEELGCSMQYTFSSEITPVNENGDKKSGDRYDIIGESKDRPVIIIEVDTHRSDQVSKKVVSRIAMNADKEVLYVTVLYPNLHVNRDAEKKECDKYINFLEVLFSLFSEPQKSFMFHWI